MMNKRFVLLSQADNVYVCCENVLKDTELCLEGKAVVVNADITVGHKIARKGILKGEKIMKYGVSIGSATQNITFGEHVHMHNMKSDYISSHTRQNKVGEES
ncbi:UxaA family hydrolase [Colwellia sp. 6_MG-2023]|uniref:UxaA family hydrolase n=1 Tax=Colwellia sp. 6_MG-2023 TaxID=3062676 RepID=UPI0026E37476|nr:UxaA family hydrolase [Colwellia sp. 6_MG-2023]MDO6487560.1 UxaA family hydrolase [Colwellia sp. 6_MG-2023]